MNVWNLLKVNDKDIRTTSVFIGNFKQISNIVLVLPLLILNKYRLGYNLLRTWTYFRLIKAKTETTKNFGGPFWNVFPIFDDENMQACSGTDKVSEMDPVLILNVIHVKKTNILLYLYQNLDLCNILGFRIPRRKLQGFKTD